MDEQIEKALNWLDEQKGFNINADEYIYAEVVQNYINRLKSSDADKERYTIELYNRAKEAEREAREWKQKLIDFDKFGDMTTPIGLLPINTDGMRQLVDGCLKLRKETVREILQYLYDRIGNSALSDSELIKNLAINYGVELND